jgi:hypothetical protein
VTSFSTHPNSVEGESFYSADLVGAVRAHIRQNLGEDVGVVYLTGAAGNTAPSRLEENPDAVMPWRGEAGLRRSGLYLGSEILKTVASLTEPMPEPCLRLVQAVLPVPIRQYPDGDRLGRLWDHEHFREAREDWPRMLREESPVDVRLHVLRLGDAAICTNPAELYVEHGLAIKAASPARTTLIAELTDGYCGYVATEEAYTNGGYSTWPARSCKLDERAGGQIVGKTVELLQHAFA